MRYSSSPVAKRSCDEGTNFVAFQRSYLSSGVQLHIGQGGDEGL